MVNDGILGLAALGLVLTVILLAIAVNVPVRPAIKAAAIGVAFMTLWAGYHSLTGLLGYPVAVPVADGAEVLAARVKEPDPRSAEPGAVWLWVAGRTAGSAPRALALPYSRETHAALHSARSGLRDGDRLMVTNAGADAAGSPRFEVRRARELPAKR